MKNNVIRLGLLISAFVFVLGCEDNDEYTGASTLTATNPSITVSLGFADSQSLIEADATYPFTVSISEPQIVNVPVYLSQTGGTAVKGEDIDFPSVVYIPSGATSALGVITVIADEVLEPTETATIKIGLGNEANVSSVNSKTVNFSIMNYTEGDLAMEMSWAASGTVTDNSGNAITATNLADMILQVVDSDGNVVHEADGSAFETSSILADDPDGNYTIVARFYDASEIASDIDLHLAFTQIGLINGQSFDFPGALNTSKSCSAVKYEMATVTKSGTSYSISTIGEEKTDIDLSAFVGTWTGTTSYDHPTQVVTSLNGNGQLQITGIGVGFMEDDWGEVITDMQTLTMEVNMSTGEFTIAETYYMTTIYDGEVQPVYNLSAVGTLNPCTGEMHLDYDFVQDGTSYTQWLTEGNGWPPFVEDITLP